MGYALAGKTMGLIGLGRLGSHMARYCKALGMDVLAWSQNLTPEKAQAAGATMVSEGGTAVTLRRGQHPSGVVGPFARADRRCGHRADEARRDPGEHLTRSDHR